MKLLDEKSMTNALTVIIPEATAPALLFNKKWYLDGDFLPHPLKFFIRSRHFPNKSRNHTD